MIKRFAKCDFLTVPNAMSVFRILLIPPIVYACRGGNSITANALVILSAVTDVADGKIARKHHMVSDIGKVLDPVADKLTEFALLLCLIAKNKRILLLLGLMAVKELLLIGFGYQALRKKDSVNSSKWYGKACTVMIYACCMILIFLPKLPIKWSNLLIDACCAGVVISTVLYVRFYRRQLRT